MPAASALFFALLGGLLPALLWLWFWLREDRKNPEPRSLLLLAFVSGMLVVPLVIPFQKVADAAFATAIAVVLWAVFEELFKFLAAYIAVLRRCDMNEPIDAMIYMITVALGFAALENALFLLAPLLDGIVLETILTGNLRFVGATLVHVLSSATVGAAMAFTFYRSRIAREYAIFMGVVLASGLHAAFNFLILASAGSQDIIRIFLGVWVGVIVLILLFERVKQIKAPRSLVVKKAGN